MTSLSINIYTGVWTNWARGPIYGATLTLSQGNGSILTAFLAVYVAMVGHSFWRITRFALHQYRVLHSNVANDVLHFQSQAILRNTGGAADAIWELCRLCSAWKNRSRSPILRCCELIVPAALVIAGFGVAAIFSTQITKSVPSTVLVQSEGCGYWDRDDMDDAEYSTKLQNSTINAASYSRACYGNGTFKDRGECRVLPKQEIQFHQSEVPSCPFQSLCDSFTPGVVFDTGEQDTCLALGINAPNKDRVLLRRRTECTILNVTSPYFGTMPGKGAQSNESYEAYYLGGSVYSDNDAGMPRNMTYAWNLQMVMSRSYELEPFLSPLDWEPIPELNVPDTDHSIFFLAQNGVVYSHKTYGPLFSARGHPNYTDAGPQENLFRPDYSIGVFTCTDQFQICNPSKLSNDRCTKLTSLQSLQLLLSDSDILNLNSKQNSTVKRLIRSLRSANMYGAVLGRNGAALQASETLYFGSQSRILPPNQWIIETKAWFSTGLALLQDRIVDFVSNPMNTDLDASERHMCSQQLIRHTGSHQNFSVLGLAVLLCSGGVVMLVGATVDRCVGWVQVRNGWRIGAREQWRGDQVLQLQRVAYQGIMKGEEVVWVVEGDAVPVTERYVALQSLAEGKEGEEGVERGGMLRGGEDS